jgi:tetraacyldisaccharide 4'-kinase
LKQLKPNSHQKVYFTTLLYGDPRPVFEPGNSDAGKTKNAIVPDNYTTVLLVTGIANPLPLKNHIKEHLSEKIRSVRFPDHKYFSEADVGIIRRRFDKITGKKAILTTEKDAIRLRESVHVPSDLEPYLSYIPIKVGFVISRNNDFKKQIKHYIVKNRGHRNLYLH